MFSGFRSCQCFVSPVILINCNNGNDKQHTFNINPFLLVYRKSFFGQHINVSEIFLRLIARGRKGEKKAAGRAEDKLPSLIQQNIFYGISTFFEELVLQHV